MLLSCAREETCKEISAWASTHSTYCSLYLKVSSPTHLPALQKCHFITPWTSPWHRKTTKKDMKQLPVFLTWLWVLRDWSAVPATPRTERSTGIAASETNEECLLSIANEISSFTFVHNWLIIIPERAGIYYRARNCVNDNINVRFVWSKLLGLGSHTKTIFLFPNVKIK